MRYYFFIFFIFLSGCVFRNEQGFSNSYYNDCIEIYDVQGNYHKVCDKNFINDDEIFVDDNKKQQYLNAWEVEK